jgi:hypothetical protein
LKYFLNPALISKKNGYAKKNYVPVRMKSSEESEKLHRISIVHEDRCRPMHCQLECKRNCPIVKQVSVEGGKLCVQVHREDKKCFISEDLCIGCGVCVKV